MSNCTLNVTNTVLYLQAVTSIPTFILGVLGNIFVLVVFCRRRRAEWTYMNIYITNMSIADCVLLVFLPVKIYFYDKPLDGKLMGLCNCVLSVYYINMYVSIFTITAISVVRYVAIKYPLKARQIFCRRNALVVCSLIWFTIGCISPIYFVTDSSNDKSKCFQRVREGLSLHFVLLLIIVGFLLPFMIMMYCSVRIIYTLRKQLNIGSRSEKIQCMFIIAANFIVFVICFFPVHLGYIVKYIVQYDYGTPEDNYSCDDKQLAHNFLHSTLSISSMNCGLDCFSYFFATKTSWNMCRANLNKKEERANTCDTVSDQISKTT
ncbi:G-protein coupled receptor 35.1 [Ctenopharyngodon idella]|uniref:G-protein coupled receptor 35.1 n=1 Tax=Ctenopharyngodon idella TaxID=7959 RepID=UPI0022314EC4|nr:G-protein coupled receptor 35.1 [Ctenopharyngodon idella]